MHHVSDVGFIDAHTEGDRADNHGRRLLFEVALYFLPQLRLQSSVIVGGFYALAANLCDKASVSFRLLV